MPWGMPSSREEAHAAPGDASWSSEWLFDSEPPADNRRAWPDRHWWRRRMAPLVMAVAAFGAGISANALIFHVGHKSGSTRVVIGQQVVKPTPPPRAEAAPKGPNQVATASLAWSAPIPFDPGYAPQSISCPSTTFCAAVDNGGRALLYEDGAWSTPFPVDTDPPTQINSISCPTSKFCAAVDQAGYALLWDGTWSHPEKVDKSAAPELTSVSCYSANFCVAMDGVGNAVVYNGAIWSSPQSVDDPGSIWGPASRDEATIDCPAYGFCVGVDPRGNAFYYAGSGPPQVATISPLGSAPSDDYKNAVACSTTTQCLAAQNLGSIAAYDGTQWSAPVAVDPSNYIASLSCPSTSFCAAVDGLLPAGFTGGDNSGDVFLYNGINWSQARNIDGSAILQSISCPNASFCVAVDQGGSAIVGTSGN